MMPSAQALQVLQIGLPERPRVAVVLVYAAGGSAAPGEDAGLVVGLEVPGQAFGDAVAVGRQVGDYHGP